MKKIIIIIIGLSYLGNSEQDIPWSLQGQYNARILLSTVKAQAKQT